MSKGQRQPIRSFEVPFTARWQPECLERDVEVQTRDGIRKIGDVWRVELLINDRLIVTGFGTSISEAENHCWDLLESYAKPHITDIRMATKAIATELRWTRVESLALVVAFCRAELGPLKFAGLVGNIESRGRGRKPTIDQTTTVIARLIEGWWWLTAREHGFSEEGWLTRAIEAIAPYCHLQRRDGRPINEVRDTLRSEALKYVTGVGVWAPTPNPWPSQSHDFEIDSEAL